MKMASNIIWIKQYFRNCILYLKDILNIGFWISSEYNQIWLKSYTGLIVWFVNKKR